MDRAELLALADRHRAARPPCRIRCCMAAGCQSANGEGVKQALAKAVQGAGLSKEIEVQDVGCLRWCGAGPLVQFDPSGAMYRNVRPEDAPALVATVKGDGEGGPARVDLQHPFFTRQLPIVLENSGQIDPERLEEYLTADGYQALYHALFEMNPADVVAAVTRSGLRGRGGAGYPTGLKWATVAKNPGKTKYVICNGDEGDPGAFMDRSVMESDPHRVLEGMAIAAYAVGAAQGFVYVRAEYPLAVARLNKAIQQGNGVGVLGTQIFGTPFNFRVDVRIGAGAFVCGEETALIASVEGKRGQPRPRPPYPAESGLWGAPTLINNVETYANIPTILRKGADWYAAIGTEKSKGTKVFSLTGKVANTGLIEVPMGTTLRTIVEEMGGGVPGGRVKAVQTGGPSGGCIPAELLDTPVDYESLTKLGSIMGSGGMIVMDQATNMVEVARFFMEFCMDESCGKCIPCRAGTVQMYRLLTKIVRREAGVADLEQLQKLCQMVRETSLCGLGQTAPNPVLSTIRYFLPEYQTLLRT
ncbi:MAG TPA: NuoF family protein [Gemmataceae bacterium]|nr:NuoF family protein [Gemmataceae bacterium]